MNPIRLFCFAVALGSWSALWAAPFSATDANTRGDRDPPAPFIPLAPRTQRDQDRIQAQALFAQGRVLAGQGNPAAALRKYQRAWRSDESAVALLPDIVQLALELAREEEAARYAIIAAEHTPRDLALVRRLAGYLADRGQSRRAIQLYERALEMQRQKDAAAPLGYPALRANLELGRLYFLTGDFKQAAACFARVRDAAVDPASALAAAEKDALLGGQPAETWSLFGAAFLEAGRFDEAAAMFTKAHEIRPSPPRLACNQASVELGRGDAGAARQKLHLCLAAKEPSLGRQPYLLLGRIIAKEIPDAAQAREQFLKQLVELQSQDGDHPPLRAVLAEELLAAGRLEEAERHFQSLRAKDPGRDISRRLVEIYRRQGDPAKLLPALGAEAAAERSFNSLGEAASPIASDAALLAKLLDYARAQRKEKPDFGLDGQCGALGAMLLEAGQFAAAEEFWEAALAAKTPSRSDTLRAWGLGLSAAGQHPQAARVLRRLIDEKLPPEQEAQAQFWRAGSLALADQTEEALGAAKRALELDPRNPRYEVRLGWILFHAKRYAEAERTYREFLAVYESDFKTPGARGSVRDARQMLSSTALAQGQFPAAEEWLERILDEMPEDPGALNDLGYIWLERGLHLNRAVALVERAVAAEPDNLSYRDSLGWGYYQLGRYELAVRELTKAAVQNAGGVIWDHLGDACHKAGQGEQAKAAWTRAAELFQKEGDAQRRDAARQKVSSPPK